MAKPEWDKAVDVATQEVRIGNQIGEIRFRELPDGRVDVRYWTAYDRNDPDVVKPTKGGFTLHPEDLERVGQTCLDVAQGMLELDRTMDAPEV